MGKFSFRKSINLGGGARINISKSGVGASVGTEGFRYTWRTNDSRKSSKKSASAVPADEVAVNRVGSIVLLVCAIPLIVLGLLLALAVPALGLGFAGFGVALLFIRKAMKKRVKMLLGEDVAYEKSTNSDL